MKTVSRRTALQGIGVTIGLPWMESKNVWSFNKRPSSNSNSADQSAPVRVAVLFSGCGYHSKEWWAKGQGKDMELGKVLTPLSPFKEKLTFISGLYNAEATKGNIHSSQTGNLLSGAPLSSGGIIRSGTSFDHLLEFRQVALQCKPFALGKTD
jgi:hypothetical protein